MSAFNKEETKTKTGLLEWLERDLQSVNIEQSSTRKGKCSFLNSK